MSNTKKSPMMFVILSFSFLFLTGCSSTPKAPTAEEPHHKPGYNADVAPPSTEVGTAVDIFGLQRELGLDRSAQLLGFSEKQFDTCQAGYGFSRSNNCQKKYFVVIHFQLLCRDSEGTIQSALTAADMRPISQRDVNWNLKPISGQLQTDSDGFGQIRTIASTSQKRQRIKLAVGNDFLYMRANEIKQVVTPMPWCNP